MTTRLNHPQRRCALLVSCLWSTLTGCYQAADRTNASRAVDSAGVTIVTNDSADVEALPTFEFFVMARIGQDATTDSVSDLQGIRGPVRLRDGTIALIDAASATLRFYDDQGREISRVGRRGAGPGEFPGGIFGLFRCAADTLVVVEQRRISVFAGRGTYASTRPIVPSAPGKFPSILDVSNDCQTAVLTESGGAPVSRGTTFSYVDAVKSVNRAGRWSPTIAEIDGPLGASVSYLGRSIPSRVPWSPVGVVAARDSVVIEGNTGRTELRMRTLSGRITRIVRWTTTRFPVTQVDRRLFSEKRAAYLEVHPEARAMIPDIDVLPMPESKPLFSRVVLASDSAIWVRDYSRDDAGFPGIFDGASDSSLVRWIVFDHSGRARRAVMLPSGFHPSWAKNDGMIGVLFDRDDRETVLIGSIRSR